MTITETAEAVGAEREQGVLDSCPNVDTLLVRLGVLHPAPSEAPSTDASGASVASGGPMLAAAVLDEPIVEPTPRFRCVACRHVRDFGQFDHHCSAGGRICGTCVKALALPVRRLIDRYGVDLRIAECMVATHGRRADRVLDAYVVRLGGDPHSPSKRHVPELEEIRHARAERNLDNPTCHGTSHRPRGQGFPPLADKAMTREWRMGLDDDQARTLLAREYGSLGR